MPEKDKKPTKYGFAEILKKAVLGCSGDCSEGCSCCSGDIKIVRKDTTETEETEEKD